VLVGTLMSMMMIADRNKQVYDMRKRRRTKATATNNNSHHSSYFALDFSVDFVVVRHYDHMDEQAMILSMI
jgi:hypothetical protein